MSADELLGPVTVDVMAGRYLGPGHLAQTPGVIAGDQPPADKPGPHRPGTAAIPVTCCHNPRLYLTRPGSSGQKYRRISTAGPDDYSVVPVDAATRKRLDAYLGLYHEALPQVYGYVLRRVDSPLVAEDVTAETFLSAMATLTNGTVVEPSIPWLIGVARHKVADHWRHRAGDERRIEAATREADRAAGRPLDHWDVVLDAALAHSTLGRLSANHRSVLGLRYLDGLPVGEIAHLLGRTPGATEALLTRAKAAFRAAYPGEHAGNQLTDHPDDSSDGRHG